MGVTKVAELSLDTFAGVWGAGSGAAVGLLLGLGERWLLKHWPLPVDKNAVLTPPMLAFGLGALITAATTVKAYKIIREQLEKMLDADADLRKVRVIQTDDEVNDLLDCSAKLGAGIHAGVALAVPAVMMIKEITGQ